MDQTPTFDALDRIRAQQLAMESLAQAFGPDKASEAVKLRAYILGTTNGLGLAADLLSALLLATDRTAPAASGAEPSVPAEQPPAPAAAVAPAAPVPRPPRRKPTFTPDGIARLKAARQKSARLRQEAEAAKEVTPAVPPVAEPVHPPASAPAPPPTPMPAAKPTAQAYAPKDTPQAHVLREVKAAEGKARTEEAGYERKMRRVESLAELGFATAEIAKQMGMAWDEVDWILAQGKKPRRGKAA